MFDKTINMFIFDGNPNGRIMAELSNWNGRVYKIARNELSQFGKRDDSQNTGVYFLFGNDIDKGDTVYIGEAERMFDRLKQHLKDDEYWSECIAVISKDNHLNKAHVKYMENKFYNLANDAKRFSIVNVTIPTCSSISEYDVAMLNEFIEHTRLLVNTLGRKAFELVIQNISNPTIKEDQFRISAARGAKASGLIVSDGFAVLEGSIVAYSTTPSMSSSLINLRNKLLNEKVIDENWVFTRDYVFTSPSLAAAVVMGRNANGKTEWRNSKGKSLNDIEESA